MLAGLMVSGPGPTEAGSGLPVSLLLASLRDTSRLAPAQTVPDSTSPTPCMRAILIHFFVESDFCLLFFLLLIQTSVRRQQY
jgi:hypothetical protein